MTNAGQDKFEFISGNKALGTWYSTWYRAFEKFASQAPNPHPPQPEQNLHQKGRHKRSRHPDLVLHRISPRIFLEESNKLNLKLFHNLKSQNLARSLDIP